MTACSTALFTDRYELTMLQAAIADGTVDRACVFEVFARRLPRRPPVRRGRRHRPAGASAIADFTLRRRRAGAAAAGSGPSRRSDYLAGYRFDGDIDGYPEGELFFPGLPGADRHAAPSAAAVILETLVLSILNHDCAIASAAARMVLPRPVTDR